MLANRDIPNKPDAIRQGIEKLRLKFIDKLEMRILYFEAALSEIRHGDDHSQAADAIVTAAHNLAGLAPSLGYEAIGSAAAETEQLWDKVWEDTLLKKCSPEELEPAISKVEALLDLMEENLE